MKASKIVICLLLAAVMCLSLFACAKKDKAEETKPAEDTQNAETAKTEPEPSPEPEPKDLVLEKDGYKLTIPAKYAELVVTDSVGGENELFAVSEKASVEAASYAGAGWLCSISTMSEDELHEALCNDMSGREVFAKNAEGTYFVLNHPTDVRLERKTSEEMQKAAEIWSELNEWAHGTVPESFIAENSGLEECSFGNSTIEIYLNRVLYMPDDKFTFTSLDYGTLNVDLTAPAYYANMLLKDATFEYVDSKETPDGEYFVLRNKDMGENERIDFFKADGNYVRRVVDDFEELYKVTYKDDSVKINEIVTEWNKDLAKAAGKKFDAYLGDWAESIAGRGVITIEKGTDLTYDISIRWGDSAFCTYFWDMTARPDGDKLAYAGGECYDRTFESAEVYKDTVHYEDGSGYFKMNENGNMTWQDDKDNQGGDAEFVKAK